MQNIILCDEERQPCEIWTRVMGYFRPVSEFNKGKQAEFYTRNCFKEEKATNTLIKIKREEQYND